MHDESPKRRPRRRLAAVALAAAGIALLAAVASVLGGGETADISSEWPRPYDPAKPFNMLGVPGVSVEQRERAEDLLLRSLTEAHRWGEYQALVDDGWLPIETPRPGGYAHLVRLEHFTDDHMLDPTRPESLVYRYTGGRYAFVAYMYVANPDFAVDDPRLLDFAGRLVEWHFHSDVCILRDEGDPDDEGITGFLQADGTCSADGADTRTRDDTELVRTVFENLGDDGVARKLAMTHVWVVARECGPFSAIAGPTQGETLTPPDERVDLCRH